MSSLLTFVLLLGLRCNFAKGLRCFNCKDLEASADKVQQFREFFSEAEPDCKLGHTPNAKNVAECKGNYCELGLIEDNLGHKLTVRQCHEGKTDKKEKQQHKACEIEVDKPANSKDVDQKIRMALKMARSKSFNFTRLTCNSDMCSPTLDVCNSNGSSYGQTANPLLSTILLICVLVKIYR